MKQITILLALLIGTDLLANVENGKAVFTANCATCHTVNGGSALGPDMNIVSYTRKKDDIEAYAEDPYSLYEEFGYSANAMPTLPLGDQEFKDVADYIDSLQAFNTDRRIPIASVPSVPSYPLSKPLPTHWKAVIYQKGFFLL